VLLPRRAPRAAAAMVLGGEAMSASDAVRAGLVTAVAADLEAAVAAWVERLSAKSGAVLALARRALQEGATGGMDEALERVERLYRDELLATEDAAEGVQAFMDKRKPRWRDR
jgi:cyclohexa-1,5-dienecarbonyl-CoA hydratase